MIAFLIKNTAEPSAMRASGVLTFRENLGDKTRRKSRGLGCCLDPEFQAEIKTSYLLLCLMELLLSDQQTHGNN